MSSLALSKFARALLASAIAVSSIIGSALAANAVTNPADNPHPITVTGDDGNTYHDGADTLPGYDDEECTYIPGAYFDFAANRVRYADGQSIPWTEWDRASGYREWVAEQNATPAPTQNEDTSASTSTGATKKGGKTIKGTDAAATTEAVTDASGQVVTTQLYATGTGSNELAVKVGANNDSNPGRETGLAILGFLFASALALLLAGDLRTRLVRKGKA